MKEDLRVIKTRSAIENAFISLVEEKGFENVKMIDIALRANVNRNTIYLHYSSKEMIIESLIEKIFVEELNDFNVSDYLTSRINRKQIYSLFEKLFNVIYKNIEFYRVILLDQNLYGYLTIKLNKIKAFIYDSLKPTLKNELVVEYLVSGVFGILRNWVVYDKGSVQENIVLITDLAIQNAKQMQRKQILIANRKKQIIIFQKGGYEYEEKMSVITTICTSTQWV